MAVDEADQQEMRKALYAALSYCFIVGDMLKAVSRMEPELWMDFKKYGSPDVEKIGEMEGYIVTAMRRLALARKMVTVIKTKLF